MNSNLGKLNKFKVLRETNLGYMISDGTYEYFLHRNETNFLKLNEGDMVIAFIYSDKLGRIAATLYTPKVTTEKSGFAEIVGINQKVGAFINIGTNKDVLLSRDDLPITYSEWPEVGGFVLVTLKVKGDRLVAKMLTKDEILEKSENIELPLNEKVHGYVYRITPDGINIVTDTYDVVYVFHTNLRKRYHIGEEVNVKILRKNIEDYNGTLIEQKERMIDDDKEVILEYLKEHQGMMGITESSDAAVIAKVFTMSKKSFKNAIGRLYKERKIEIMEDKIVLL